MWTSWAQSKTTFSFSTLLCWIKKRSKFDRLCSNQLSDIKMIVNQWLLQTKIVHALKIYAAALRKLS